MFDISKFTRRYDIRYLRDSDADDILAFCLQNQQYYQYCGKQPSRSLILNDLHVTPPGVEASAKYYVGFYDGAALVAVLDLIDGYPKEDIAYLGFFMVAQQLQGRQIGSEIIQTLCRYLKKAGMTAVRLGIDKGNPQSTHFWKKNGFAVVKEVERDGWTILLAEKAL